MARDDQLRATLQSIYPNDLPKYSLQKFIETEMVLSVLEALAPDQDVVKAYLLLCNYSVIGAKANLEKIAYLQQAHLRLRTYASKQNWEKALDNYQSPVFDGIRQYKISEVQKQDKCILQIKRNTGSIPAPGRPELYREEILTYQEKTPDPKYAKSGTFSYKIDSYTNPLSEVTLSQVVSGHTPQTDQKEPRAPIKVSYPELLFAAREIHKEFPNDYCENVLLTNTIKEVIGSHVKVCEQLTIDQVTNIVGMVGSGKSTLIKVLSYVLAKRNQKVILVVDTVTEVMSLFAYFNKLHVSVSPLIGRNERIKYVEQLIVPGEKYLDDSASRYLTAACLLDGMEPIGAEAPQFGQEPCFKLINHKRRYVCPYYNRCPNTLMQRDTLKSNIVVTTVAGLAATRIGASRTLFVNYVLKQADLVVFDECDRVQKTLDEFFSPSTAFIEFIHEIADECHTDLKKPNEQRLINQNDSYYAELLKKAATILDIVQNAVGSERETWKSMLSDTFSAATLLERLKEDGLADNILAFLQQLIDKPREAAWLDVFELSCNSLNDMAFDTALKQRLKENKISLDDKSISHVKLFIIIAKFDAYIHDLDEVYALTTNFDDPNHQLYNFLQARFTAQQRILPSALIGNLFGMKSSRQKGLELYRQYAFGRALMTELPWLRMRRDGAALGPHALLLSGSSWAKGCLEYHVNCPVNYLLEAEQWKRDVLAKTEVMELGILVRVSGNGRQDRQAHLDCVIEKSMDSIVGELQRDGKILMIVNSYQEAAYARQRIQIRLTKVDREIKVAAMVRSEDVVQNENEAIPRGGIAKFHLHPARILIAPAAAIERGYNIVDETGHSALSSVFFLVRPMPVPDDIGERCSKLNGMVAQRYADYALDNEFKKVAGLRVYATKQWHMIERNSQKGLKYLPKVLKKDTTASIFILILQIFGRLARITDPDKPAPRIYFADGAFRRKLGDTDGYDCLNELLSYLKDMMNDPQQGEIAKTLYAPFYEAFKKGIQYDEYSDLPDDLYTEEEY